MTSSPTGTPWVARQAMIWALVALTGCLTVVGIGPAPERGIVCPRGQHAYHAPGGAVTCIPNGQLAPAPPTGT